MKKLKNIGAFIRSRSFLAGLFVVLACAAAAWWWDAAAGARFAQAYRTYQTAAAAHEQAAFLPGDTQNPVRGALNQALAQALAQNATAAERLSLAQKGLSLIEDLNKQVDAIGDTAAPADAGVEVMEQAGRAAAFVPGQALMLDIVRLAKDEASTTQEIRGLSYRADFETQQIFNRIIADRGALTQSYTLELNNDLPQVEGEFDQRTNLYNTLVGDRSHRQEDAAALGIAP